MRDRPKVGEILLEAGIIDEMQLASALGEQARWGRRLGMTLIKLGMVQEGQLVRALARQFDMPVASLAGKKIAPEVIALVPARVAIEHTVIPLFTKKDGPKGQLFLGMEDPSDLGVLDDLAFRTGMAIRPVMVGPTELGEAIDRYYNARPTPSSSTLPDALRASDTLTETHLRRPDSAPTLSELLKPGPSGPDPVPPAVVPPPAAETAMPAAAPTASPTNTPTVEPAITPRTIAPPAESVFPAAQRRVGIAEPIDATPLLPVTADADLELEQEAEVQIQPGPVSIREPAPASASIPEPAERPAAALPVARPAADRLAADVARAIEESERTRLVAKAIAHLLIEKGVLTYEELQARIDKLKPARPGTPD